MKNHNWGITGVIVTTIAVALVGGAALFALLVRNKSIFINDWFVQKTDVRGVDVSGHKFNIDMQQLETIKGYSEVTDIGVTEDLKLTEFDQSGKAERPFLNIIFIVAFCP